MGCSETTGGSLSDVVNDLSDDNEEGWDALLRILDTQLESLGFEKKQKNRTKKQSHGKGVHES